MKTFFLALLASLVFALPDAGAAAPPPGKTLAVVVIDSLQRGGREFYDFHRIEEEFGDVFARRHWPVQVTFERFAANTPDHELELQIFYRGINDEFGERVYRAWTVLNVGGKKHDFGIVQGRYQPRPGEQTDDVIRKVFRAAAEKTAALVEPALGGSPAPAAP